MLPVPREPFGCFGSLATFFFADFFRRSTRAALDGATCLPGRGALPFVALFAITVTLSCFVRAGDPRGVNRYSPPLQ
jgi:hypothetical protein